MLSVRLLPKPAASAKSWMVWRKSAMRSWRYRVHRKYAIEPHTITLVAIGKVSGVDDAPGAMEMQAITAGNGSRNIQGQGQWSAEAE